MENRLYLIKPELKSEASTKYLFAAFFALIGVCLIAFVWAEPDGEPFVSDLTLRIVLSIVGFLGFGFLTLLFASSGSDYSDKRNKYINYRSEELEKSIGKDWMKIEEQARELLNEYKKKLKDGGYLFVDTILEEVIGIEVSCSKSFFSEQEKEEALIRELMELIYQGKDLLPIRNEFEKKLEKSKASKRKLSKVSKRNNRQEDDPIADMATAETIDKIANKFGFNLDLATKTKQFHEKEASKEVEAYRKRLEAVGYDVKGLENLMNKGASAKEIRETAERILSKGKTTEEIANDWFDKVVKEISGYSKIFTYMSDLKIKLKTELGDERGEEIFDMIERRLIENKKL